MINQIRAFLLDGMVFAKSSIRLREAIPEVLENANENLTPRMRNLVAMLWSDWKDLKSVSLSAARSRAQTLQHRTDNAWINVTFQTEPHLARQPNMDRTTLGRLKLRRLRLAKLGLLRDADRKQLDRLLSSHSELAVTMQTRPLKHLVRVHAYFNATRATEAPASSVFSTIRRRSTVLRRRRGPTTNPPAHFNSAIPTSSRQNNPKYTRPTPDAYGAYKCRKEADAEGDRLTRNGQ